MSCKEIGETAKWTTAKRQKSQPARQIKSVGKDQRHVLRQLRPAGLPPDECKPMRRSPRFPACRPQPGKRSVLVQVFRPKEISAPQQARRGEAWAAGRQGA